MNFSLGVEQLVIYNTYSNIESQEGWDGKVLQIYIHIYHS